MPTPEVVIDSPKSQRFHLEDALGERLTVSPRAPLRVGDDFGGQTVAYLLGQSSKVEVFVTTDNHLKWDYLANGGSVPADKVPALLIFDGLMSEISAHAPKQRRKAAFEQLGKALFHSLDATAPDQFEQRFEPVQIFLRACMLESVRFQYVVAFLASATMLAAIFLLLLRFVHHSNDIDSYLWAATCGIAGAVMSVMYRSGALNLDTNSGTPFLILQGACRPILAAMFATFTLLACKGDFILAFAKDRPLTLMCMAVIAGFSERFVPEIMLRLEGSP